MKCILGLLASLLILLTACGSDTDADYSIDKSPVVNSNLEVTVLWGTAPAEVGQFQLPDGTVCTWAYTDGGYDGGAGLYCGS